MIFEKSYKLWKRATLVIPGGINSNVRSNWEPHPVFYSHGNGCRVWDVDGNEFIDYVLARGPLLYGHSPKPILDAMKDQLDRGMMYAGQCELEVELAEKICELVPGAEQVRFNSSGSESIAAVLRLARAITGRQTILRFEGHYHGWFDNIAWNFAPPLEQCGPRDNPNFVPVSNGQLMDDSKHLAMLPWNDEQLLQTFFEKHGDELAAVITEPIMCNKGAILPEPGFLEKLRDLCDTYDVLLIFDEVITGFRIAVGGAQEYFKVTPDLTIYAKALGGGMIVSALAGKLKFMKAFGDKTALHAGTYNANPPTMAGSLAALNMLSDNEGELLTRTQTTGQRLMDGIKEIAASSKLGMQVRGVPVVFNVSYAPHLNKKIVDYRTSTQTDLKLTRKLFINLQNRGIRVTPEGTWFVSTAHTQQDIDETLKAFKASHEAIENEFAETYSTQSVGV